MGEGMNTVIKLKKKIAALSKELQKKPGNLFLQKKLQELRDSRRALKLKEGFKVSTSFTIEELDELNQVKLSDDLLNKFFQLRENLILCIEEAKRS